MALHGRVQHRAGGLDPGQRIEVEPCHDFGGRARRRDPAARHDHDGSGEPRYFVDRVADEDDGYADLVAQPLDVVDDLGLAGHVERGQRLVHEQQLRLGHERASQRHALALAARKGAGPAVQERLQAEQRHDPLERGIPPLPRREAVPVEQVPAHAEMGEQPPVLEHVADPAALGPQVDPGLRIEEHAVVEHDPPRLGPHEAGYGVGEGGLAGTRGAEQRDDAVGFGAEGRIEREGAAGEARADRQHYPSSRRLRTRARSSEPTSAAKAMTMAITIRRKAPSSPPGTWV